MPRHCPAQEARWPAEGKSDMSTPISARMFCAVRVSIPSTERSNSARVGAAISRCVRAARSASSWSPPKSVPAHAANSSPGPPARPPSPGDVLRRKETRVAALDLTFSAPKSVSAMFAVSPDLVSRTLVECHADAVDAAPAYSEQTAAFVRRGPNAARRFEYASGLVLRRFATACRALDPQLAGCQARVSPRMR